MHIAYHFDADSEGLGTDYGTPILRWFFAALLSAPQTHLHMRVSVGDLLVHSHTRTREERERLCLRVLRDSKSAWLVSDESQTARTMVGRNVFVLACEGMVPSVHSHIDRELRQTTSYLGALQLSAISEVHWALYSDSLIPVFRYWNRTLRILHSTLDGDSKDEGLRDRLLPLGFASVTFEDTGARHTILDQYTSFGHAKRAASLADAIGEHLVGLVDDVVLRLGDEAPLLIERLRAAFRALGIVETAEDIAQVAVSCRRFLEGLADALYPARDEAVDGRQVGQRQWKNRLWAYAQERAGTGSDDALVSQVEHLGRRVDALCDLAQKGVHASATPLEAHRLAVGVFLLTYDLLALLPPPTTLPLAPHAGAIEALAREAVNRRPFPDEQADG